MKTLFEKIGNKTKKYSFKELNIENLFKKEELRVLRILTKEPKCSTDIARELRLDKQKIYYYIKKFKKLGLIEEVREEKFHGAIKKYLKLRAKSFGIILSTGKESKKIESDSKKLIEFFEEFIEDGVFNGVIVVGSPTPHGPYLTAARDGHYAAHLSFLLGNFCSLPKEFIIRLDTDILSEKAMRQNMILVGGPVTNIITNKLNESYLKTRFKWDKYWRITFKNKSFAGSNIGVIAKIQNPWNKNKSIIVISGLDFSGTKAGVIALTKYASRILKNYNAKEEFYAIFRGLDKDGDGKIDTVKQIA